MIGIKTLDEAGKILQDYSYEYNILGNQRIAIEDGKKTSYFYDSMNRLKEVVGENQKESYLYDPVGNRIQRESNNKISRYFYDKKNRLKRIQDGKDLTYFHYDNQGNLLSEKTKDSLTRHFYDGFNRNTKTVKGQNIQENYYDPEGMRYKISENGLERNFVFSGSSIVAELDEKLNLQTAYTRGLGLISRRDYTDKNLIDKTLKKEEPFRSYYLENAHGDIKGIVGENGKILNKYRYDSFGKIEEAEEKIRNIFKYAGEQHDPLTNQYYLRARYYNPVIGRQEDRYRGDGLNLYAYCGNNPINYIDPTGYSSEGKENPYDKIHYIDPAATGSPQPSKKELKIAAKQLILGEFTKEKNTLGTMLQIETSIVGVDIIGDARDVAADLSNWKWTKEHLGKTVLDGIGLFPVIGAIKYGDEIVDIAKQADNISDASKAVKTVEGTSKLVSPNLMAELAQSGQKYTPDAVQMITKKC